MNFKNVLLVYVLFSSPFVMAQNEKISFGFEVTPAITDWRAQTNENYPFPGISFASQVNGKFGGSIGVYSAYGISEKIEISLGVNYYLNGVKTNKIDIFIPPFLEDDPAIPDVVWNAYNIHFVTIPLRVKYNFLPSFYIRGGGDFAYIVDYRVVSYQQFPDERKRTSQSIENVDYNKININANLGIGYQFKISDRILGYVEPSFNMSFMRLVKDVPLSEYPYYVGLTIGSQLK
ncbi:outer membrane beta-barrel protein [Crocinitomix catalasitica]|uniref:outer membrane beta-barrel protein n=1 Tax=Crocinitomix catalasitica TaxID=184607 RepID=UPI0009FC4ECB|nr:outer membrane beta-barrel protein [Crocinitomix catalasitica]